MPTTKPKNLALLLLVFIAAAVYFSDQLTLETFKNNKLFIADFIAQNYVLSVMLFFLSCIIFVNSPVPFAAAIKMLSGFFFGFYMGAIYNIAATILACVVGFGISRYAFKDLFERMYYERLQALESEIEENGFYYFLSLRLVMVVPYFLINILAGISRISFKKYLLSSALGVMPASFVYANGGNKLEHINSIDELFSPGMITAILLIALMSLSPLLLKKYRYAKQ
ncbi:TVP38/TMEM64 family protein [Methylomonas rivi]|uniref:TVP38/TMEM64 family membrane protein n=1 Tax=Methylomonas rivi TaxID=2952226 RepID=A0ABT1U1E2_9GAMM|nr:TVP38/TMEM64 family protein [Methylomonas sp. WSC-6]MCQ8127643.1 TVP38/TMEM64 family protein [Methylomonas sp. WSC-6]